MTADLDMNLIIGTHDLVLITLDTLRFDVAQRLFEAGELPNISTLLPATGWERRHAPGTFTYASHHAIFAGFLPTPATPGPHPRRFASNFSGSETTTADTWVFEEDNLVAALAKVGYHTICIGGVGFFNKQNAIGRVFPSMFQESHWERRMGVTDPASTEHQLRLASARLDEIDRATRVFLFINISALHQPNHHYLPGATTDTLESHAAALCYVDSQLPRLLDALTRRAPSLCILCADHGTTYGEDGFFGHRLAHEVVTTVPYAERVLPSHE